MVATVVVAAGRSAACCPHMSHDEYIDESATGLFLSLHREPGTGYRQN